MKFIGGITQIKTMNGNVYNPNLLFLHECFDKGKSGASLRGSARSGKTWSGTDFTIWWGSTFTNHTINILRVTHKSFDTTLYEDFNRRFPAFGLSPPFQDNKTVVNFKLFDNQVNFLGAENENVVMGVGSDLLWFNESIDIPGGVFDQMEMRCRKYWFGDYNPRTTQSYLYDKVETREDVGYLATTFLDNPYISPNERRKILGYEPTHPDDRQLIPSKRRPHPTNIKAGTADDYMWNVYGLGLPSSPEGLIFQHVNWIKEFPENIDEIYFGVDFGWENNPTAIVKVGRSGRDLYLEKLFYQPTASYNQLEPMLKSLPKGFHNGMVGDPGGGGAGMISEARRHGFRIHAAYKPAGSILYGISVLKKFRLHIVDSPEFRKEQANYKRRIVNGVKLDDPVDAFNDLWDATRYVAFTFLRNK